MTIREVTVVVHVTEQRTAPYSIDEADYLDWLNGDEDTPERIRAYLLAGDEFEVIQSVYDGAESNGGVEIWASEIEEVLA